MRNPVIIFCFLAALLVQTVAMAAHRPVLDYSGDTPHSVLHQAGVSHHHHHEGGPAHLDNSDESKQHVQADYCPNAPGMLPTVCSAALRPARFNVPPLILGLALASPFIEGPRRPPRLTA